MKKIKKLLSVLLMSIMSVSAFAEDAIIDGINYSLNDKTLEAKVAQKGAKYSGDIIIPETVDYDGKTYSVTSIGIRAFYDCKGLTSVTIGNSVTSIGDYAFDDCPGLTSVTIGNSVTSIGIRAFSSCSGLTSITIPNSVTSIGDHAFSLCFGLTSVTIGNSVKSIGKRAFYYCSGLTSVTIPNSVTSIGDYAFEDCSGLTSVTIGNRVTSIGDYAFYDCKGLTSVTIGNRVTSIGKWAFYGCYGLTSITIPNSVTSIGKEAFYYCTGLTSVTIGNSVTSIGEEAFRKCKNLTSVISLIEEPFEINENTFNNWFDDHDVYVFNTATLYVPTGTKAKYESTPAWNKFKMIVEQEVNAFAEEAIIDGIKYSLNDETLEAEVARRKEYSGDIIIPETVDYDGKTYSVTNIGDYAFFNCKGLTSVTIPNSVTSIGRFAFSYSAGLTSVTIPNSVTSIGERAFSYCAGLTSVTIGNSVTNIGDYAFYDCSGLTSVTIPNSVTSIGDYVFYECSGLTSVTIPNSVTSIGRYAFSYCSGLTSVTIPNSVTSIGIDAFENCSGLTSVTIPNSVTSIGKWAFYGCTGLTSVISLIEEPFEISENTFYNWVEDHYEFTTATLYVPAGTKSKYESTPAWNKFANIVELSELIDGIKYSFNKETLEAEVVENTYFQYSGDITIPEKVNYKGNTYCVTSIGEEAFSYCTGLTSITIPNSVTNIGYGAFYECKGLTSVTIPNSVTSISEGAFSSCLGLESIIVEEGNTVYDSRENCNAIIETETNTLIAGCKNTVIPGSVTSIGNYAFGICEGLTSITIPNSVTTIGGFAFADCRGLTSITIPNSVTSIGDWAFSECTGLTSVISLIEEPFEINENTFYNSVEDHEEFTTATLYVPAGTKSKYESTPAWNKFKMIVEQEVNAVESVETDAKAEETERYNIGGQRISSPQKGLNIVKMSDGTTRKVMCK